MARFSQLNCLATLAALTIFAVTIAASVVNWYQYQSLYQFSSTTNSATGGSSQVTFNSTQLSWSLVGLTTQIQPTNGVTTSTFATYDPSTSVWSTYKLLQAFVLIALITSGILALFLIVCFASAIRNQLLFVLGMNVLRIALLAISALILIALVIAFLGHLGITNAFTSDVSGCQLGYCRRFQDSTKVNLGTLTIGTTTGPAVNSTNWGPVAGWYLILGCIPVAIILTIIVVINKFPIPVDSVTIGEAL